MIPTLSGRWITRLFLTLVIGVPVSLPFVLVGGPLPFVVLFLVLVDGLLLDVYYDRVQQRRWDHDWPTNLQVRAGVAEGVLAWLLLWPMCCGLGALLPPFAPMALGTLFLVFPVHYAIVWLVMFAVAQGPLRVLFPYARFRGGRLF